eukprot:s283_g14.t1
MTMMSPQRSWGSSSFDGSCCFLRPAKERMRRTALCLGSVALASGKVYFSETFGDGWESRWTPSEWKKSDGTQGTWQLSAGKWFGNEAEDKGVQTAEDSRFFGLSAGFDSFSNADKELIIQYQAKYEKDIECGGGYVKVKGNTIFDNVIITDDVKEADAFVEKWKALSEVEKAKKKEEDDKKAEEAKSAAASKDDDDDDDDKEEED